MNELLEPDRAALAELGRAGAAVLEQRMLSLPQADCPVVHHFGPGVCIREVHMRAGTFAVGHHQRFEHMNVLLRGRVLMLQDDGGVRELVAPMIYVGKPGRKVGYVVEDVVWQNIYATELRDVDAVEEHFIEKSDSFRLADMQRLTLEAVRCEVDRVDFRRVVAAMGFTEEQVWEQSANELDQIPMPDGGYAVAVRKSPIHGRGLFATAPIAAGQGIAPARIGDKRTPAGRYTNHSRIPNAYFDVRAGGIWLVALRDIAGQRGGQPGEEITVDYRQALEAARRYQESAA